LVLMLSNLDVEVVAVAEPFCNLFLDAIVGAANALAKILFLVSFGVNGAEASLVLLVLLMLMPLVEAAFRKVEGGRTLDAEPNLTGDPSRVGEHIARFTGDNGMLAL
jgi:hypothetical protein